MTVVDLRSNGAALARAVLRDSPPTMTTAEYLAERRMMSAAGASVVTS